MARGFWCLHTCRRPGDLPAEALLPTAWVLQPVAWLLQPVAGMLQPAVGAPQAAVGALQPAVGAQQQAIQTAGGQQQDLTQSFNQQREKKSFSPRTTVQLLVEQQQQTVLQLVRRQPQALLRSSTVSRWPMWPGPVHGSATRTGGHYLDTWALHWHVSTSRAGRQL